VCDVQGKPAIAHRDVKSRNILVMSDGRCCVADLGLAVLQRPPQPGVVPPMSNNLSCADELKMAAANLKVGTRRCMAPEILDETINVHVFDSYRQADVYSFALVVWEISRRFVLSGLTQSDVLCVLLSCVCCCLVCVAVLCLLLSCVCCCLVCVAVLCVLLSCVCCCLVCIDRWLNN